MTHRSLAAAIAFVLCSSAYADVTIKTTATGKGFGISGSTKSTTYIKGLRMRTDTSMGNKNLSTIFDVDAQKMYVLDVDDKEAKVWDMAAFASELSTTIAPEGMQASMKANGQTKAISGQNTDGYDIEIVVPTTVGGMAMTMHLTGTVPHLDLEGGVYVIRTEDGAQYRPIELPEEFRVDGLPVEAEVKRRDDIMTIDMAGTAVELLDIRKRTAD